MTKVKAMLIEVGAPTFENIDLTEKVDLTDFLEEQEFVREKHGREPPNADDLGIFEGFEQFEYAPYDRFGRYKNPHEVIIESYQDELYDELLLDHETGELLEWMMYLRPRREQFQSYEDYKNALWGWENGTSMSGIEQAAVYSTQMYPIHHRGDRWYFTSTLSKRSKIVYHDSKWAYACRKSYSALPDVTICTANQLAPLAGLSTKTQKKIMADDPSLIQISDRCFVSLSDYKRLVVGGHLEVVALISSHPREGCNYLKKLKTFTGFPNKQQLKMWVGARGFDALVKYKVLKSISILGHHFSYYYYPQISH